MLKNLTNMILLVTLCLNIPCIHPILADEIVLADTIYNDRPYTIFQPFEYEVESQVVEFDLSPRTYIPDPEPIPETCLSREDIELIALVTMAEAEGECEEGKRLVIDTILNRMDSGSWPDTASDVIYQKNQFSSMWNGRVDRCYVSEDICQLVVEELQARTNHEVVYFTAGRYGAYGTPLMCVDNHYFSSL